MEKLLLACASLLPPEQAHRAAVGALKLGVYPSHPAHDSPALASEAFGLTFRNPVGLAAGFDKNAEVIAPLFAQGFGFVEAGTVTPRPQPGNARPRVFRLREDEAVINRYGFNSRGAEFAVQKLTALKQRHGVVGINIGKNKESTDAKADYLSLLARMAPFADYIAVNLSSPNTPGLRDLQVGSALRDLLRALVLRRKELAQASGRRVPLLVKIAPDLTPPEKEEIAEILLASGVDGAIVCNTTVQRPSELRSPKRDEQGGLSGRPLAPLAQAALSDMYRLTKGRLPLIGVGGIGSAADAYGRIRAGASLVQVYTALVYQGFAMVPRLCRELEELLQRDGFRHVREAVGADHR